MSFNALIGGPLTVLPSGGDGLTSGLSSGLPGGLSGGLGSDGEQNGGFGAVLSQAVNQVSTMQNTADSQVNTLLTGGGNVDMSKVMISMEKADVAFQLMMQVRNKIVSAYQDIEKMQF
jgi:flagellar hook-basal body complex protein FliE